MEDSRNPPAFDGMLDGDGVSGHYSPSDAAPQMDGGPDYEQPPQKNEALLSNMHLQGVLDQTRPSSVVSEHTLASQQSYADDITGSADVTPATETVVLPTQSAAQPPAEPEKRKTEFEELSDYLLEDPHDGETWQRFIALVDQTGDVDKITNAYDRLLEAFPNTPSAQIAYITHFLTPPLFPKAEALFSRFLRPSPSVDLWKFYLVYVRRVNPNFVDPTARQIIKKAYEFALNHIGQDKDSGDIWRDYIDFLKNAETHTTWDAQQKMDSLRSAYQRAVVIPIENVEVLWRELDAFESALNKITAKKFMADLSPSYMTARTTLRDLRRMSDSLSIPPIKLPSPTATSPPPLNLPSRPTWSGDSDRTLCHAWKTYLKWEESNPLDIEDSTMLQGRISAAYKKAVIRMQFYPEIWYLSYNHTVGLGKAEEAATLLKQAMDANQTSFLLHFAYAELQESQNKFPEVHDAFESLIKQLHKQLEIAESSIAAEVEAARASVPSTGVMNGELALERDEREKQVVDRRQKEVDGMKGELGIVWIMLMRFARRAEGLKPARSIFGRARKDKFCPWGVYEAAALMEYHCTKAADVAAKIFEIGLKIFGDNVDYVVRYLGFLISINDENNARALFERVIGTFSPEDARPLWERWARYEYHFGDLAGSQKLEKRLMEVYPSDPPIKRFAQRYTYLGIDAIAGRDLGFAFRKVITPTAPTAQQAPPPSAPVTNTGPPPNAPTGPSHASRRLSPDPPRRRPSPPPPPPSKRFRPSSPPPAPRGRNDRDRDRDRWEDGPSRRPPPPGSPRSFSRDRDRDVHRETENRAALPSMLLWFLGTLPAASSFDGPVFRTEDLMELLRHGNIPAPSNNPPPGPSHAPPPPPRARSPAPFRGRGSSDYPPRGAPYGGRRY